MSWGPPPAFEHLHDSTKKAALVTMRKAVAPILGNNLLPHFTDHSVLHSDSLTRLADKFIEPLQATTHLLNERELTVLYGACYLHDIGLQYERAGTTQVMQAVLRDTSMGCGQRWDEFSDDTKRKLLRKYHGQIASEMICGSVRAAEPPVGIQLTDEFAPAFIAAVVEAHTLAVDCIRYRELTKDGADMRVALLSGIFRVVDILDVSRRRAKPEKAHTLDLDITAQTHWWRHYYTEDITFDQLSRTILIWFDFPTARAEEYAMIVPELQVPAIKDELAHHQAVFNRYGVAWNLEPRTDPKATSTAEEMPDDVWRAMLKELHQRREREQEQRRQIVLLGFRAASPYIYHRLDELDDAKGAMVPADYVRKRYQLAVDMWESGGKRSAWMLFCGLFDRDGSALSPNERLEIGLGLASMMLRDDAGDHAVRVTQAILGLAENMPDSQANKFKFWELHAECLVEVCAYPEAVDALNRAIILAPNDDLKARLEALLAEVHCLQGEIGNVLSVQADEGGTR